MEQIFIWNSMERVGIMCSGDVQSTPRVKKVQP